MNVKKQLMSYGVIKLFISMALSLILITSCNSFEIQPSHISKERAKAVGECRVVEHPLGKTCIPLKPQQIIILQPLLPYFLFAIGMKESIMGTICHKWAWATKECGAPGLSSDQLKYLKNIENVGDTFQPSLEKILFLKPDLILAGNHLRSTYKQLSDIAPTVFFDIG
jgi:iron complex transport system substrate-binding protein